MVDFDHTLFSSNSTELFIATCKPSFLVAIIEFLIRGCIPWRVFGISKAYRFRDYTCCVVIAILTPWNYLLWRRAAPDLFAKYQSRSLATVLEPVSGQVVIVTFGMRFIVRDLLRGSEFERTPLIATPFLAAPSYFSRGKLSIARERMEEATVASSTAISDSVDDMDLLSACRTGWLIEPQGEAIRASEQLYIPLRYTARAKYPRFYFIDQILLVDLLLALCATSHDLGALLRAVLVVPFLLVSLMAIYELGYFENDMVAARREENPTLTDDAARFQSFPLHYNAWIWAMVLGVVGFALGYQLGLVSSVGYSVGVWVAALAAIRVTFFVYNRTPAASRMTLYAVLQIERYTAIFLVLPATLAGSLLALSQITTMWVIYLLYRLGADKKAFGRELFRLMFFVIGLLVLTTNRAIDFWSDIFGISMAFLWLGFRLTTPFLKGSSIVRLMRPRPS